MIRTFVSLNGAKIMFFVISEKKKKKIQYFEAIFAKKRPVGDANGP